MGHQPILWNDAWNLNIPSIDKQHKNIVKAINSLEQNLSEEGEQTLMDRLFEALDAYARIHFEYEIDLLIEKNYTDIEQHQLAHDEFLNQIEAFRYAFRGDYDRKQAREDIRSYLLDWLVNHIDQTDRKYCKHLLSAGIS